MYKVLFTKKSQKDLDKISKKDKKRILLKLLELQKDPFIGKRLKGKLTVFYSLRVWPYRIIYEIKRKRLIILIIRIGHRQGVYK